MDAVGAILGLVIFAAIIGIIIYAGVQRAGAAAAMPREAQSALARWTTPLFGQTGRLGGATATWSRVEGIHDGAPLVVTLWYPGAPSDVWLSGSAFHDPERVASVTVGLRGARPKLALVRRLDRGDPAHSANEDAFGMAWHVEADEALLADVVDAELRADIGRFSASAPNIRSIVATPEGLTIAWVSEPGTDETERVRAAAELATKIAGRVVDFLERQGHARVRVDPYRDGEPAAEALDAEEEARDVSARRT